MARKRKQDSLAVISVKVPREDYTAIKAVAASEDRSLAAELRRLIRQRIAEQP